MPAIKPRTTQKHLVRHITRLYRENNETLFAYAKFNGEPTDYAEPALAVCGGSRGFRHWLGNAESEIELVLTNEDDRRTKRIHQRPAARIHAMFAM